MVDPGAPLRPQRRPTIYYRARRWVRFDQPGKKDQQEKHERNENVRRQAQNNNYYTASEKPIRAHQRPGLWTGHVKRRGKLGAHFRRSVTQDDKDSPFICSTLSRTLTQSHHCAAACFSMMQHRLIPRSTPPLEHHQLVQ